MAGIIGVSIDWRNKRESAAAVAAVAGIEEAESSELDFTRSPLIRFTVSVVALLPLPLTITISLVVVSDRAVTV